MTLGRVLTLLIILWVCIYTVSYARWTWKNRNKLGSIMLFILVAAVIIIPLYAMYFR